MSDEVPFDNRMTAREIAALIGIPPEYHDDCRILNHFRMPGKPEAYLDAFGICYDPATEAPEGPHLVFARPGESERIGLQVWLSRLTVGGIPGAVVVTWDPERRLRSAFQDLELVSSAEEVEHLWGVLRRARGRVHPGGRGKGTGYWTTREEFLADARAQVPTKPRDRRRFTRGKLAKALGAARSTIHQYCHEFGVDFETDIVASSFPDNLLHSGGA